MDNNINILIPIFLPIIGGILMFALKNLQKKIVIRSIFISITALTSIASLFNCFLIGKSITIANIAGMFPISFEIDEISVLFTSITSIIWLVVGIYSGRYMDHEKNENLFFGSYLLVFGILIGIDYSSNLVSFYLFYELMTIASLPLVLHSRKKDAIKASLKYLIYSLFGAFMGLVCIFFVLQSGQGMDFVAGGFVTAEAGRKEILLVAAFLGILGFGTKAGIFPLHDWLPTAHPVAPSPASALMSGLITKAGVLGIIRLIYFVFSPDFIRGQWVQFAFIVLTLTTVLLGSALAFKEKNLKKRLAYSTVSQISYILFGLSLLEPVAFGGALMHVLSHASIKVCLFLCVGVIMFKTHSTDIDEIGGIAKKIPAVMICFTVASLALVGIPPLNAFFSKWFLVEGSFNTQINVIWWLGPVVLIVSALLTAGYLLSVSYNAFFKQDDGRFSDVQIEKRDYAMIIPLLILAVIIVLTGVFSDEIMRVFENISSLVL